MMNSSIRKLFSHTGIVVTVCILIVMYMGVVLSVALLSQKRLQASLEGQLDYKVREDASDLTHFFHYSKDMASVFARSTSVRSLVRSSAKRGPESRFLASGIEDVSKKAAMMIRDSRIDGQPIFRRVTLVDDNQNILIDVGKGTANQLNWMALFALSPEDLNLTLLESPRGESFVLTQKIPSDDTEGKTLIVVELAAATFMTFLENENRELGHGALLLRYPNGEPLLLEGRNSIPEFIKDTRFKNHLIYINEPVQGTDLMLEGIFATNLEQASYTSNKFLFVVALLVFPLLWAIYYLMRLHSAGQVLTRKMQDHEEQQTSLRQENDDLQAEVERRISSEKELSHQLNHDELTGLPNSKFASELLDSQLAKASNTHEELLVLAIDLERFRQVNKQLGYHNGDRILKAVAERLQILLKPCDFVARIGANRYLLIMPNLKDHHAALDRAYQFHDVFELPFLIAGEQHFISGRIGAAIYPQDATGRQSLMDCVETAMQQAGSHQRSSVNFYSSTMNQQADRMDQMEGKLREAIQLDIIKLELQPIHRLSDNAPIGVEALARWSDPEFGEITPEEFIPLAEKTGLIYPLGDILLEQACSMAAQWQHLAAIPVAVNISSVQMRFPFKLLSRIEQCLKLSGLPPEMLVLELTESVMLDQTPEQVTVLRQLTDLGVPLCIDDFGTGFSSLSYLRQLEFNRFKLDRGFVTNIETCKTSQALVKSMVDLARALDRHLVIEGIENQQQQATLLGLGCYAGQGYGLSVPMSLKGFLSFLENQDKLEQHIPPETFES